MVEPSVGSSSFLAQEMTVRLKRNSERMMSMCFTWFPNWLVLGEPNIYHDSGVFYKNVGILLGGCLTVRISGSYSQEMIGLDLGGCYS